MKRTVLTFALICLTAAGMLAVGCGKEEKPAEPDKAETGARRPTPKVRPEAAPAPAPAPKPAPAPAPTPAPAPAPAAGKKYPGMWADAKVGTMVKMRMVTTKGTKTDEVIKADKDTVTVRTTMTMPGVPASAIKPTEQMFPRYSTTDPVMGTAAEGAQIKKLADKTLTLAGKSLKCEVYETVVTAGGRTITSRSYMCKEVPGWMVRMETDAMGKMGVMMELVDFKK